MTNKKHRQAKHYGMLGASTRRGGGQGKRKQENAGTHVQGVPLEVRHVLDEVGGGGGGGGKVIDGDAGGEEPLEAGSREGRIREGRPGQRDCPIRQPSRKYTKILIRSVPVRVCLISVPPLPLSASFRTWI